MMLKVLGTFLLGILIAIIVNYILKKIERKVIYKTKTKIDDLVFPIFRKTIVYIIIVSTILLTFKLLNVSEDILKIASIFIYGYLVIYLIDNIFKIIAQNVEEKTLRETSIPIISKTIKYSLVVIVVILAIRASGYDITPLLAGMGIAGLAISFAARETLSNIIAGLFIMIDKPFSIGDRIEVRAPQGYATWGEVLDIGFRSIKVRTTDNLIVVIPNSQVINRDIINYTINGPIIRLRIPVMISYESDFKKAEKILLDIARNTNDVLLNPEPKVVFKELADSGILMELRVWINDARKRTYIVSEIIKKILEEFKRHGIEIPYPKREIIIKNSTSNKSIK